jgi:hypothetical protein
MLPGSRMEWWHQMVTKSSKKRGSPHEIDDVKEILQLDFYVSSFDCVARASRILAIKELAAICLLG